MKEGLNKPARDPAKLCLAVVPLDPPGTTYYSLLSFCSFPYMYTYRSSYYTVFFLCISPLIKKLRKKKINLHLYLYLHLQLWRLFWPPALADTQVQPHGKGRVRVIVVSLQVEILLLFCETYTIYNNNNSRRYCCACTSFATSKKLFAVLGIVV